MFSRMMPRVGPRSMPAMGGSRLVLCAALACGVAASVGHAADDVPAAPQTAPALAVPHPAPARSREGGLDHRVKALSKALDLDARQQAELRKVLERQQLLVRKIWSDASLTATDKASATRAAEDQSGDQIRAFLNEEQKKRYNLPRPQRAQSPPPDVGAWMDAAQKR